MGALRRIAVAGGGTAGHVLAGLAFLKAYREETGASGFFIGCARGTETRLVPKHGEELVTIAGSPFKRESAFCQALSIVNMGRGAHEARSVLRSRGIEIVIGVGGYASLGAGLAARSLGIPLVIHEANAMPGAGNRLLARFADRICVGMEGADFGRCKAKWTGNPPGVEIPDRKDVTGVLRFLVTGGSEGSPFLNREAPALFAQMKGAVHVRHLTGQGDVSAVKRAYSAAGVDACVLPFTDQIAEFYADSDAVIACPGALTLTEIAAAGLPALLVPLSGAAD
jgi:UDP-N-acetylglucosamine--N-acetylmuramyl-(pentapeptide) pyrophosphoryl-undecaprenol N-acetylglucosamine transferase